LVFHQKENKSSPPPQACEGGEEEQGREGAGKYKEWNEFKSF